VHSRAEAATQGVALYLTVFNAALEPYARKAHAFCCHDRLLGKGM
jgi:hypothetical protein